MGCLGNRDIGRVCVLVGNPFTPPPWASSCEFWEQTLHVQPWPVCTWNHFAITSGVTLGGLSLIIFLGEHFWWMGYPNVCPRVSRVWVEVLWALLSPLPCSPDGACGLTHQTRPLQPHGGFGSWKVWSALPGCDSGPVLRQPGGYIWSGMADAAYLPIASPSKEGRVVWRVGP